MLLLAVEKFTETLNYDPYLKAKGIWDNPDWLAMSDKE